LFLKLIVLLLAGVLLELMHLDHLLKLLLLMVDKLSQSHFELLVLLFFSIFKLSVALIVSIFLLLKLLAFSHHFFLMESLNVLQFLTAFTLDLESLFFQLAFLVSEVVFLRMRFLF
jgi:hypothetical protein